MPEPLAASMQLLSPQARQPVLIHSEGQPAPLFQQQTKQTYPLPFTVKVTEQRGSHVDSPPFSLASAAIAMFLPFLQWLLFLALGSLSCPGPRPTSPDQSLFVLEHFV